MSHLVMSCHLTSCHVLSYLVMSRLVTSCQIMSCHVMSRNVTSRLVMSCHLISRLLTSSHVLSYHVMSRVVMSRHLARESCSGKFLPSSLNSSIIGGGVAPTRFSKPWPCAGIRLGATLSLWRRAHCERARVAPCTFFRPEHRFAWERAGCARVAPCAFLGPGHRFAWQAAGIVRFGSMLGACWERAGWRAAALCRGDWVPGEFCTRMANVRFAWQAAGIVCLGACPGHARGPCRRRCAVGIGFRGVSRARMI